MPGSKRTFVTLAFSLAAILEGSAQAQEHPTIIRIAQSTWWWAFRGRITIFRRL